SSTTKSGEKYKDMLTSWLLGIVILCFYHYVMRYTVIINDTFVQMVDEGSNIESTGSSNDAMLEIRNKAGTENNIALTIVYIIMLGQLIVLLGVYYKRIFMMAFLITIFPVVATLFIWEKTKGGAKALTTWTKEYVVLVLTQTFHAVVYVVLVDGGLKAFNTSGNWFVFIISVLFLFEAEKIIRSIFSMKSSANTIGDLATAGVAAWGVATAAKKVFKTDSKSKSQDETDKEEATKTVDEARKTTAVNNSVHQQSTTTSMITNMATGNYNSSNLAGENTSANSAPSGSGSGGNVNSVENGENNPMDNWDAAQALIKQEALGKKTKRGILSRAAGAATHTLTRGAGVTLGLASGLASGSMQEGLKNAAIGYEIGGAVGRGATAITGWVKNKYAGRKLKAKVRSGALDEKLRQVGFDLSAKFDEDEEVSNARARILREALAREMAATTSGGSVKGELKALKTINRGRKREQRNQRN
ncbi:MAG: hypothetical protein J6C46_10750, partial [Clostridia bacterium]|nr:hypothetical protein [Clostridia bacterium]